MSNPSISNNINGIMQSQTIQNKSNHDKTSYCHTNACFATPKLVTRPTVWEALMQSMITWQLHGHIPYLNRYKIRIHDTTHLFHNVCKL